MRTTGRLSETNEPMNTGLVRFLGFSGSLGALEDRITISLHDCEDVVEVGLALCTGILEVSTRRWIKAGKGRLRDWGALL